MQIPMPAPSLPASTAFAASIATLRPTQAAVGFEAVAEKRKRYRSAIAAGRHPKILNRRFPVVVGPGDALFVIDGHHWLRALLEEGVDQAMITVAGDLHTLRSDAFWAALEARGWSHCHDADGRRIPPQSLPTRLADLTDDPYRSLATALRRAGLLAKPPGPFGDFLCAEALRMALPAGLARVDYPAALERARLWAARINGSCMDCMNCSLREGGASDTYGHGARARHVAAGADAAHAEWA